jgi:7-cyano-7-deazaguanine synthase
MRTEKAYILLSGGQDSFVSLIWTLQNFKFAEAVSIDYGQRHSKELQYAVEIAKHFGIKHTLYNIGIGDFFSKLTVSTLLSEGDHNSSHKLAENLPASFVPNRNGIFLTIISNHAFKNGEEKINIVIGACETDYSGYPDCRDVYIKAKQKELTLGLDKIVKIYTPLMWKSKARIFEMAHKAGKLKELLDMTLTCYNGNENLNEWGRGCGECPACKLRKKGFEEFKKETGYRIPDSGRRFTETNI